MNITDPIADLLTRIRNGQKAQKEIVAVPASKLKIAVVHLLQQEGFVRAYKCIRDKKQGIIKVALRSNDQGDQVIREIKRISRPGLRRYVKATEIPMIKNGFGVAILSTSKGVLTCKQAREHNVGGEIMCSVY